MLVEVILIRCTLGPEARLMGMERRNCDAMYRFEIERWEYDELHTVLDQETQSVALRSIAFIRAA